MLRWLPLSLIGLAVGASSVFAFHSSSERTLSTSELWKAVGGGTVAMRCCSTLVVCQGPATHCSTHNGAPAACPTELERTLYSGNRTGCNVFSMPTTCTFSTADHDCKLTQGCVYDDDLGECLVDQATGSQVGKAPDTCSPACP